MTAVLVTGASGFIGAALARTLAEQGFAVRGSYRSAPSAPLAGVEAAVVGELSSHTDWSGALSGVDVVVHAAGPAHAQYAEGHLQAAITGGSARLAEQAERAGVSRFVFISSIKASAARTSHGLVSERDPPAPEDAYGRAKLAAEGEILARGVLRPVVLRPPLVCAADAKANFARLLRLAAAPVPLPFAALSARRNVISRDSLISAVLAVVQSVDKSGGVFHVADQPALSPAEMIAALRAGLSRPAGLFALPGIEKLLPRSLVDPLEVNDAAFRALYGYGANTNARTQSILASVAAAWKATR